MEHLYMCAARVERLQYSVVDGRAIMGWSTVKDLENVPCRLDLNFLRPGKDIPAPVNAGRAPDRIGIMFCDPYWPIKAGDQIVTIPNEEGKMPVEGTFEIKVIPDMALDYDSAHHIEVQILESVQQLDEGDFPSTEDDELLP